MKRNVTKFILFFLGLGLICGVLISDQNQDIRNMILKTFESEPRKELFKIFHFLYKKTYDLNTDEGVRRYKIFKENLKFVERMNSKNLSYKLGINEFSDMSDEEFRKNKLGGITPNMNHKSYFLSENPEVLPFNQQNKADTLTNSIDWTPQMTPARSQASCGSCWAFATIGALEGNYNINFQTTLDFSQQQLVDCELESFGCQGGYPSSAFEYIKNYGIGYYNAYPYTSGMTSDRGACKQQQITLNKVVSGYSECPYKRCSKTQYLEMLSKGPLVIYMDGDGQSESNSAFKHYSGGIIDATMTCSVVNHAVVAVGIDRDENGEFLISRNSWGSSWGENGNFRIRIRSIDNTCFMQDYALLPSVTQTFNPVPPPEVPGCLKIYSQCGLQGTATEICSNNPSITSLAGGFDIGKFSQVKVFFTSQNCRGSYYTFNTSYTCFINNGLSNLVNSVKSVIVDEQLPPSGCVWLYGDNCLSGNKVEICTDVSDLNAPQYNFGNKTSSFKLGPGIKGVTIYLNKNYSGSYATISRDYYGLSQTWMDKEIESIKLIK